MNCIRIVGLLVVALTLGACGGGEGGTPVSLPATTGTVSGTVLASSNGAPLAGVAVTAAGRGASTAADGTYALTEVPAGDGKVISFELAGHAKVAGATTDPVQYG